MYHANNQLRTFVKIKPTLNLDQVLCYLAQDLYGIVKCSQSSMTEPLCKNSLNHIFYRANKIRKATMRQNKPIASDKAKPKIA